jgi:diacylglycerol kinase family enzyme
LLHLQLIYTVNRCFSSTEFWQRTAKKEVFDVLKRFLVFQNHEKFIKAVKVVSQQRFSIKTSSGILPHRDGEKTAEAPRKIRGKIH